MGGTVFLVLLPSPSLCLSLYLYVCLFLSFPSLSVSLFPSVSLSVSASLSFLSVCLSRFLSPSLSLSVCLWSPEQGWLRARPPAQLPQAPRLKRILPCCCCLKLHSKY